MFHYFRPLLKFVTSGPLGVRVWWRALSVLGSSSSRGVSEQRGREHRPCHQRGLRSNSDTATQFLPWLCSFAEHSHRHLKGLNKAINVKVLAGCLAQRMENGHHHHQLSFITLLTIIFRAVTSSSNSFKNKPHFSFKFLIPSRRLTPWRGDRIWVQPGSQSWSAILDNFLGPSESNHLIYKVGIAATPSLGYWVEWCDGGFTKCIWFTTGSCLPPCIIPPVPVTK